MGGLNYKGQEKRLMLVLPVLGTCSTCPTSSKVPSYRASQRVPQS